MINTHYCIKDKSSVTVEMLSACTWRDLDGLRESTDSKVVLGWEGSTPTVFLSDTIYDYDGIKTELDLPKWNEPTIFP